MQNSHFEKTSYLITECNFGYFACRSEMDLFDEYDVKKLTSFFCFLWLLFLSLLIFLVLLSHISQSDKYTSQYLPVNIVNIRQWILEFRLISKWWQISRNSRFINLFLNLIYFLSLCLNPLTKNHLSSSFFHCFFVKKSHTVLKTLHRPFTFSPSFWLYSLLGSFGYWDPCWIFQKKNQGV